MSRPALSASRATAVFDLLAATPERAFSMAEIIKGTGINIASCHALLNALVSRGYLTRREDEKLYMLGPGLMIAGQAAKKANPLFAKAQDAAERLALDVSLGVVLTTILDGEIVALSALPAANGLYPGMRPGHRFPLTAPAGAHIMAWSGEDEVDRWISSAGNPTAEEIDGWRAALSLIRSRGYQVTLRMAQDAAISDLMATMAAGAPNLGFKAQASELMHSHGWHLAQPERIEPDETYDVALIAAPIFDQHGRAVLSVGLAAFSGRVGGREIVELAEHLMRTCLEVMRDDRMGRG